MVQYLGRGMYREDEEIKINDENKLNQDIKESFDKINGQKDSKVELVDINGNGHAVRDR